MIEFQLKDDYIELIKLLKITHIASTGGHAKILVDEGDVILNGQIEYRKRAKLRSGDLISCQGKSIQVV